MTTKEKKNKDSQNADIQNIDSQDLNDSPLNDIYIGEMTKAWADANALPNNYKETVSSTNDWAKNDLTQSDTELEPFQIYLTDSQTQGRGRFDRTWSNPKEGSSLLSSWSFEFEGTPSPYTTARFGVALFKALRNTWPTLNFNLKAPNDIYISSQKVAGLLVETISQGKKSRLIVGLGVNVFKSPKDIAIATNLLTQLKPLPLTGDEWIQFLDRLMFEFSVALQEAAHEPDSSTQAQWLHVYNLNTELKLKYSSFETLKEDLWR